MPRHKLKYMEPKPQVQVQPTPSAKLSEKFAMRMEEAVEYTSRSDNWLRQTIKLGLLKLVSTNRPYLILREELERWVRDGAKKDPN